MDDGLHTSHISLGNFRPRCLACQSENLKIDVAHGVVECLSCHRTILLRETEPVLVDLSVDDYLLLHAGGAVSVDEIFSQHEEIDAVSIFYSA